MNSNLSAIRSLAGRAGAKARWHDHKKHATECIHVYPADGSKIKRKARREKKTAADIVHKYLVLD